MERINQQKAQLLYDYLDQSAYFSALIEPPYRSLMNIPFSLAEKSAEALFLERAASRGLVNLKGHRSVGGMRASLYNAMPLEGVKALIAFLTEFEADPSATGGLVC